MISPLCNVPTGVCLSPASGFCGLMWEQLMCRRLSLSVPNKPYQHIDCGQTNIERITAIAQHMHWNHVEHEFILHLQPAASSSCRFLQSSSGFRTPAVQNIPLSSQSSSWAAPWRTWGRSREYELLREDETFFVFPSSHLLTFTVCDHNGLSFSPLQLLNKTKHIHF